MSISAVGDTKKKKCPESSTEREISEVVLSI